MTLAEGWHAGSCEGERTAMRKPVARRNAPSYTRHPRDVIERAERARTAVCLEPGQGRKAAAIRASAERPGPLGALDALLRQVRLRAV